jgi:GT2 family glycosyltransferase
VIGVVIPTYNSAHTVGGCIARLGADPAVDLLCVDNASSDGTADVVRAAGVAVEVLPSNRGFSAACNHGARRLAAHNPWVAFVNPDIRLDAAALVAMAGAAPPDISAVAPLVVDPSGTTQPDLARRAPTLAATSVRYLLGARADVGGRRQLGRLRDGTDRWVDVDVTSGGCLLVRTSAFEEVGGFSEAYFLNFEDVELCLRLRQRGGRVAVDTAWTAVHDKGTSSTGVAAEQRMLECARAEMLYFERNAGALRTVLVAPVIVLGMMVRMLVRRLRDPAHAGWRQCFRRQRTLAAVATGTVRRVLTGTPVDETPAPVFVDS